MFCAREPNCVTTYAQLRQFSKCVFSITSPYLFNRVITSVQLSNHVCSYVSSHLSNCVMSVQLCLMYVQLCYHVCPIVSPRFSYCFTTSVQLCHSFTTHGQLFHVCPTVICLFNWFNKSAQLCHACLIMPQPLSNCYTSDQLSHVYPTVSQHMTHCKYFNCVTICVLMRHNDCIICQHVCPVLQSPMSTCVTTTD